MAVELHHAFSWDCPDCGAQNFERGIVKEFSEIEKKEIREDYGIGELQTGDYVLAPRQVTCATCKRSHAAFEYNEAEY